MQPELAFGLSLLLGATSFAWHRFHRARQPLENSGFRWSWGRCCIEGRITGGRLHYTVLVSDSFIAAADSAQGLLSLAETRRLCRQCLDLAPPDNHVCFKVPDSPVYLEVWSRQGYRSVSTDSVETPDWLHWQRTLQSFEFYAVACELQRWFPLEPLRR